MRDASASYWFSVGDTVQVVESVIKAGVDLKGRNGSVVETWEKCDVDPTCCCAEQVDVNMAVRVRFQGTEQNPFDDSGASFLHYFAEAELTKVKEGNVETLPFDGMSCTAFKLDQLQMGEQARRIQAFQASQQKSDQIEK